MKFSEAKLFKLKNTYPYIMTLIKLTKGPPRFLTQEKLADIFGLSPHQQIRISRNLDRLRIDYTETSNGYICVYTDAIADALKSLFASNDSVYND